MIKCVNSGCNIERRCTPNGVPKNTPKRRNRTNFQYIFFHILGIIKKLAIISNKRIIGTISLGGNMNERSETLEAEKPKPLKPLTNEAKRITLQKNINSNTLRFIVSKYSIIRLFILSLFCFT